MKIVILLISILAVSSLFIILFAEISSVNKNISSHSTSRDVIKIASVGNKTSVELSNKQTSEVIEGNDSVGRIASIPKKCLGSALCPD